MQDGDSVSLSSLGGRALRKGSPLRSGFLITKRWDPTHDLGPSSSQG